MKEFVKMEELLVQKALRSGMTLEELDEKHGIEVFIQNGLLNLSYSQLRSKTSDPLASECRGLILREGSYNAVCCPMDRFLNYGQTYSASLDKDSLEIQEKLDGTNIKVFYDDVANEWLIGTRGRPRADVFIDDSNITFSDLFKRGLKELFNIDNFQLWANHNLNQTLTYVFELCSPLNQIVILYKKIGIYLLAVKCNVTFKEFSPVPFSEHLGIPLPKRYPVSKESLEWINDMVQNWSAKEHEGVVLVDKYFNRLKIKNLGYCEYNKSRDSLSSLRNCLKFIIEEKDDDFVQGLPEMIKEKLFDLKEKYLVFYKELEKDYEVVKLIENQKTYALVVKRFCKYPAPLFMLKGQKIDSLPNYFKELVKHESKTRNLLNLILKDENYDEKD